jgi:hypothetical protein
MKTCTQCKITKNLESFYRRSNGRHLAACKTCENKRSNKWKENNKERHRLSSKNYYEKHKERYNELQRNKMKNDKDYRRKQSVIQEIKKAIKSRKLKKRDVCEICYASSTQCHHEDYNKPLDIVELCKDCHALLHKQYRNNNIVI